MGTELQVENKEKELNTFIISWLDLWKYRHYLNYKEVWEIPFSLIVLTIFLELMLVLGDCRYVQESGGNARDDLRETGVVPYPTCSKKLWRKSEYIKIQ